MTSKTRIRLKVGVVGVGRLGKVYVRDLAARIPETTVVAVADTDRALADEIAEQFDVPEGLRLRRRADRRPQRRCRGRRQSDAHAPGNRRRRRSVAETDVLRETARAQPRRMRGDVGRRRQVGHVLSDGLHAPLRSRICGGEGKDCPGRDWETAGLQIDVARSVPSEPRVRESGEQRRHHGRHGHSRFRSRALVHGRRRDRVRGRCRARLSGNGVDRRHRQRDCHARVRGWASRGDRSHAQRRLRVRHQHRPAWRCRHGARRLSPRDADRSR